MKANPLMLVVILLLLVGFVPSVLGADYGSYQTPSIHLNFDNNLEDDFSTAGYSNATIESETYVTGINGQAIFVDVDNTLEIPYLDEITADSYSVCSYIYKINSSNFASNNYWRYYYFWNVSGSAEMEWSEFRNTTQSVDYFSFNVGRCDDWTCNNGIDRYYDNITNPQVNNWIFSCAVYNETDFSYYENGIKMIENVSQNGDFGTYTHIPYDWSQFDIHLGNSGYGGVSASSTGYLDEFYFYEFALDDNNVTALYNNLPIAEVPPCTPDWTCSGYNTPVCLINDTNTASCNSVTDNNACGENYTGDYSEYANQTGVCDYCTPSFSCDGYATPVCLINDTNTASCNSVADSNSCYATTSLPSDQYSGDYTEYANQTGVCDYCTPSWSCDNYVNTTCIIVNATGTLNQSCNSVADSNSCYATTSLPSDQYAGNYSEYFSSGLVCEAGTIEQINYGQRVLLALLPLIIICGSCLVYIGINFGGKKNYNEARNILALAVVTIAILLLIALL